MIIAVENSGFKIFKTLIWDKGNSITNMWYMDSHEYIIFARNGRAKKINHCGSKSILSIKNKKGKLHPSEKPVELYDYLINNSNILGSEDFTILDHFIGSGNSGVSAMRAGNSFIGIEIDEHYFKIAKTNIEETGYLYGLEYGNGEYYYSNNENINKLYQK